MFLHKFTVLIVIAVGNVNSTTPINTPIDEFSTATSQHVNPLNTTLSIDISSSPDLLSDTSPTTVIPSPPTSPTIDTSSSLDPSINTSPTTGIPSPPTTPYIDTSSSSEPSGNTSPTTGIPSPPTSPTIDTFSSSDPSGNTSPITGIPSPPTSPTIDTSSSSDPSGNTSPTTGIPSPPTSPTIDTFSSSDPSGNTSPITGIPSPPTSPTFDTSRSSDPSINTSPTIGIPSPPTSPTIDTSSSSDPSINTSRTTGILSPPTSPTIDTSPSSDPSGNTSPTTGIPSPPTTPSIDTASSSDPSGKTSTTSYPHSPPTTPSIYTTSSSIPSDKTSTTDATPKSDESHEEPTKYGQTNSSMIPEVITDIPCKNPSEDAVLPLVLLGGDDGVYWANMVGERLPASKEKKGLNAYSVDYHYKKNYLFFTAFYNSIVRMRINHIYPAGDEKVILKNVTGDVQIAVDWVQDYIYFLSLKNKTIEKSNLSGEDKTLIFQNISSDFGYPGCLIIDPYDRFLFFVDTYRPFRINLTSSNNKVEEVKFTMEERSVSCLALNRHTKRLYFSGIDKSELVYVASSTYDGADVVTYDVGDHWNDIFSIDVYRDTLFFAHFIDENTTDSLYMKKLTSIDTAEKIFIPRKPENDIGIIRVYHSNIQSPTDFRTCLEADDQRY